MRLSENLNLDPAAASVLKKYGILRADGNLRTDANGDPILTEAVIEKFLALDSSRNKRTLSWVLLQAGGGHQGLTRTQQVIEDLKNRRVNALIETGLSETEAEAKFETDYGPRIYSRLLPSASEADRLRLGNVFGYYTDWPGGPAQWYAVIHSSVTEFQANMADRDGEDSKLSQINAARRQRADSAHETYTPVEPHLPNYASVMDVIAVNQEFRRYYKRRAARSDIRYLAPQGDQVGHGSQPVYQDEWVTAWLPATMAAAMASGHPNWCVSNQTEFERAFSTDMDNQWTSHTSMGPLLIIHVKLFPEETLKYAVHTTWRACSNPEAVKPPYSEFTFTDEANRGNTSWHDILDAVGLYSAEAENSLHKAMAVGAEFFKKLTPNLIKSKVNESERLVNMILDAHRLMEATDEETTDSGLSDPKVVAVLKEHGVIRPNGTWSTVLDAEGVDDVKAGDPIIKPETVLRLLALDTTKSKKMFSWIMREAGGGKAALDETQVRFKAFAESTLAMMTNSKGWVDDTGEQQPAMSEAEALNYLKATEQERWEFFFPADVATIKQFSTKNYSAGPFGYAPDFPGWQDRYLRIEKAINGWQTIVRKEGRVETKLAQYNKSLAQTPGAKPLTNVFEFDTLTSLENWVSTVQRFFQKMRVNKDLRYVVRQPDTTYGYVTSPKQAVVHKNSAFQVLIPATIKASIESGAPHQTDALKGWCISAPGQIDAAFSGGGSAAHWTTYNQKGPFVFIQARSVNDPKLGYIAVHFTKGADATKADYWDAADTQHTHEAIMQMAKNAGVQAELTDAISAASQLVDHVRGLIKIDPREDAADELAKHMVDN